MPIVNRELTDVRALGAGGVRVCETQTDALGVDWVYNYSAPDAAAATGYMNAREMTAPLRTRDTRDVLVWVQGRQPVDAFDFTGRDIDRIAGEDYVCAWFADSEGEASITVAWWLEGLDPAYYDIILARLEYATDERAMIKTRSADLLATEPTFSAKIDMPAQTRSLREPV